MECWWYDHLAEDEEKPKLKGFSDLVALFLNSDRDFKKSKLCIKPSEYQKAKNIILFVHAGVVEDYRKEDWKRVASKTDKRYVIFVSSHPEELKSFEDPEKGINSIKYDLLKVASALEEKKVDHFIESCKISNPDMSVFELAWPEWVMAAYLIRIAEGKGIIIDTKALPECEEGGSEGKGFWECVKAEFNRFSKAYGVQTIDADPSQEELKTLMNVVANKVA